MWSLQDVERALGRVRNASMPPSPGLPDWAIASAQNRCRRAFIVVDLWLHASSSHMQSPNSTFVFMSLCKWHNTIIGNMHIPSNVCSIHHWDLLSLSVNAVFLPCRRLSALAAGVRAVRAATAVLEDLTSCRSDLQVRAQILIRSL